ncbi:MAG: FeoB-associated Cys-rich membrane protein [Candidatus Gastranaerophilaceae bacterium]
MHWLFYLIAALIAGWTIYCLVMAWKNRKSGCKNGCGGCPKSGRCKR